MPFLADNLALGDLVTVIRTMRVKCNFFVERVAKTVVETMATVTKFIKFYDYQFYSRINFGLKNST